MLRELRGDVRDRAVVLQQLVAPVEGADRRRVAVEELERQGVIFLDTDTALKEHPELFKEYFGTVIPVGDNGHDRLAAILRDESR